MSLIVMNDVSSIRLDLFVDIVKTMAYSLAARFTFRYFMVRSVDRFSNFLTLTDTDSISFFRSSTPFIIVVSIINILLSMFVTICSIIFSRALSSNVSLCAASTIFLFCAMRVDVSFNDILCL